MTPRNPKVPYQEEIRSFYILALLLWSGINVTDAIGFMARQAEDFFRRLQRATDGGQSVAPGIRALFRDSPFGTLITRLLDLSVGRNEKPHEIFLRIAVFLDKVSRLELYAFTDVLRYQVIGCYKLETFLEQGDASRAVSFGDTILSIDDDIGRAIFTEACQKMAKHLLEGAESEEYLTSEPSFVEWDRKMLYQYVATGFCCNVEDFRLLFEEDTNPRPYQALCGKIYRGLKGGSTLVTMMASLPDEFPAWEVKFVEMGEARGQLRLALSLYRLAGFLGWEISGEQVPKTLTSKL